LHAAGEAVQGMRDLNSRNVTSDNALQCTTIDCQEQSGAGADNRSLIDFSDKSDVELYDMFQSEFAHVKPLLDGIPANVVEVERRRVAELILRNADIFSKHKYDLGLTSLASRRIDTSDHPPIAEPLRRHPKVYLDVIDQSIDRLVEAGICEPCSSPWAANIVLVKKKGSPVLRVTVDYRKLNEITVKDKFPLPRISDRLDALSGSVYFSSFDQSHSFF